MDVIAVILGNLVLIAIAPQLAPTLLVPDDIARVCRRFVCLL